MSDANRKQIHRDEHLSEDEFAAVVLEQELPPEGRARIHAHLEACSLCSAELKGYREYEFDAEAWPEKNASFIDGLRRQFLLTLAEGSATPQAERAPVAEVTAQFWKAMTELVYRIAADFRGIWGLLPTPPLAGLPAYAQSMDHDPLYGDTRRGREDHLVGKTPDGRVAWSIWPDDEGLHVAVGTEYPELSGTLISVSVNGVPITGTPQLPHLKLEPCRPGKSEFVAEAIVRRRDFAAKAAELSTQTGDWTLELGPVRGQE